MKAAGSMNKALISVLVLGLLAALALAAASLPAKDAPAVFKVEPDPAHPDAVIVWYSKALTGPAQLIYGSGLNPYVNLTDSLGMAVRT